MNEEKSIVEQIHAEFDSAVGELTNFAIKSAEKAEEIVIKEDSDEDLTLKVKRMEKLGFGNSNVVQDFNEKQNKKQKIVNKKQNLNNLSENLLNEINEYKVKFPGFKIITFSQTMKICEKYNLHMGESKLYSGDIPDKNLQDIASFDESNAKKNMCKNYKIKYPLSNLKNLISSSGRGYYAVENGHIDISYQICAPLKDFNTNGCIKIGREIFTHNSDTKFNWEKPNLKFNDPIVLFPIILKSLKEIGFAIVTAWGLEAQDEMILNPISN
jgi:hypothetical protein